MIAKSIGRKESNITDPKVTGTSQASIGFFAYCLRDKY